MSFLSWCSFLPEYSPGWSNSLFGFSNGSLITVVFRPVGWLCHSSVSLKPPEGTLLWFSVAVVSCSSSALQVPAPSASSLHCPLNWGKGRQKALLLAISVTGKLIYGYLELQDWPPKVKCLCLGEPCSNRWVRRAALHRLLCSFGKRHYFWDCYEGKSCCLVESSVLSRGSVS